MTQDNTDESKFHPMDVRRLLEQGEISAVDLQANSFSIDRDIFDVLFPRLGLKPIAQTVYLQLYRHSYGRGLNCAQLSNAELQRLCNITHTTVRSAINQLIELGCLSLVRRGIQHDASIYRVHLPHEVLNYDSATRVESRPLDVKSVAPRMQQEQDQPQDQEPYDGPVLPFNMLRKPSQ